MKAYIDTISTAIAGEGNARTAIVKKLVDVLTGFANVSVTLPITETSNGFYAVLGIGGSYLAVYEYSATIYLGLVDSSYDPGDSSLMVPPYNTYYYQQFSRSEAYSNVFLFVTDDEENLLAIAQRRTGFFVFHSGGVEMQGLCVATYDGYTDNNYLLNFSNYAVPVSPNHDDMMIKCDLPMELVGYTAFEMIDAGINNHSLPAGKIVKFPKAIWNPMAQIQSELEDDYPVNIIGAGIVNNKTNNPTMTKIEVTLEDNTAQKYIHIGGTNWMPYDTLTQRSWSADE